MFSKTPTHRFSKPDTPVFKSPTHPFSTYSDLRLLLRFLLPCFLLCRLGSTSVIRGGIRARQFRRCFGQRFSRLHATSVHYLLCSPFIGKDLFNVFIDKDLFNVVCQDDPLWSERTVFERIGRTAGIWFTAVLVFYRRIVSSFGFVVRSAIVIRLRFFVFC